MRRLLAGHAKAAKAFATVRTGGADVSFNESMHVAGDTPGIRYIRAWEDRNAHTKSAAACTSLTMTMVSHTGREMGDVSRRAAVAGCRMGTTVVVADGPSRPRGPFGGACGARGIEEGGAVEKGRDVLRWEAGGCGGRRRAAWRGREGGTD